MLSGQALEEAAQGIAVCGSIQKMYGCGTWGHSSVVNMVGLD